MLVHSKGKNTVHMDSLLSLYARSSMKELDVVIGGLFLIFCMNRVESSLASITCPQHLFTSILFDSWLYARHYINITYMKVLRLTLLGELRLLLTVFENFS